MSIHPPSQNRAIPAPTTGAVLLGALLKEGPNNLDY